MSIRKNTLNLLLALTLALSSVVSANHIHDVEHTSADQAEQCLVYHQLQFDSHAESASCSAIESAELSYQLFDLAIVSPASRLHPPARAPPQIS